MAIAKMSGRANSSPAQSMKPLASFYDSNLLRFADCPLQYVDALRFGKISAFKDIEAESVDWWFPTLDRGSGALIHFAVDHGQVPDTAFTHRLYFCLE